MTTLACGLSKTPGRRLLGCACMVGICFVPAPARPGPEGLFIRLVQFPRPALPGAYTLGPHRRFQYGDAYVVEAVVEAALRTRRERVVLEDPGPAAPLLVCDLSREDGRTPEGRHPRGAHEDGLNLDLGYYLSRPEPARPGGPPSRIVCPQYAGQHCVGPPDDLDVLRQAYFFAALVEGDPERRLAFIAVDGRVKPVLDAQLGKRGPLAGTFDPATLSRTQMILYGESVDMGTGWFRFHHDHAHARYRRRDRRSLRQ